MVALLVVMCLGFGAIAARLVWVQGISAEDYADLGAAQRLRSDALAADRGAIFDRNGRELALSIPQRTVWANPHLVTDPAGAARALAPILQVDEGMILDRLTRDAAFVYLARKVDDTVAEKVEKLRVDGVSFMNEPKRFSPAGVLAAPVLGQVGLDNNGLSGLEQQYEELLAGQPGELVVERDPDGNEIAVGNRELKPARAGQDLVLTIDRSLQYETERALSNQIVASQSKGGIAVVMDPRTGEILAMANLVAGPEGQPPQPAASNSALTAVYEPGSVNKVITIAGALEEGTYGPFGLLSVPDNLLVADHVFRDHDPHPTKAWSVTDILVNSSNTGTIMIGQALGKARLDRYLRAFGFGRKTGLDYPGESAGLMLPPDEWSGTTIGTVPIGQGIAVTAVQMLSVYNTLANDGVYVEPRLIQAIVDGDGNERRAPAPPTRRVVSSRTARQLTAMMQQVVSSPHGTGTAAAIDGYSVAGKTGTARKPPYFKPPYKYIATFAGFVPAESPRLSAIVILDEPTPIYGGLVSAPAFAEIAKYGLRLYKIPPPAPRVIASVPQVGDETDAAAEVDGSLVPVTTLLPASTTTTTP